MNTPAAPRRQQGFTLVEALAAMSIAAIVAGIAVPSWQGALARRHLEGAATQFETDVHLARSSAAAMGATVRLTFGSSATGQACYVVHTGTDEECQCGDPSQPTCRGTARPLQVVRMDAARSPRMSANVGSMAFQADFGTVTPTATVEFAGRGGGTLHQMVNIMGRVRSCSPTGDVPGYRSC